MVELASGSDKAMARSRMSRSRRIDVVSVMTELIGRRQNKGKKKKKGWGARLVYLRRTAQLEERPHLSFRRRGEQIVGRAVSRFVRWLFALRKG